MPHHSKDLSRLMPLLRHATVHLGVEQTPTGKRLGLTHGRMTALAAIGARTDCSMSELARELGLPSPLATRVTDELVSRDLVQRSADPDDRRRVLLRLTPDGSTAYAAVQSETEQLVSAVVERMTPAETESLLLGLHAFLRVLHAPAGGAPHAHPEHDHDFPTEELP